MQPIPYLKRIAGRSGWYFQRAVPRELQSTLKRKTWIWKAGTTLADARRAVNDFLVLTDSQIAKAKGEVTKALIENLDKTIKEGEVIDSSLGPEDLFPRHSTEEQNKLFQRVVDLSQGVKPKGRTAEDLIKLATRLKAPAATTRLAWMRYLTDLLNCVGVEDITDITKVHAQQYRDHLLDTVAVSTAVNRLRSCSGLFELAVEEEWIDFNPLTGISKRIRSKGKPKDVVSLAESDRLVETLPQTQRWLYVIMRYTGLHSSEAAGIRVEDIDLRAGILHIRPNELRPLKNNYRTRDLPIVDKLRPVLEEIVSTLKVEQGYVFPALYNSTTARWAAGLNWRDKIKITPKDCRDNTATILRNAGVNESVLGRILGHTPKTVTGMYGSVTVEAMAEALSLL